MHTEIKTFFDVVYSSGGQMCIKHRPLNAYSVFGLAERSPDGAGGASSRGYAVYLRNGLKFSTGPSRLLPAILSQSESNPQIVYILCNVSISAIFILQL